MAALNGDIHVQAKLFTKLESYSIPDTQLSIPSVSGSQELNALVKSLLINEDGLGESPEFEFLVNGEFFQTNNLKKPNLDDYIKEKGFSTESVIEIEYILKQNKPRLVQSLIHSDWVSSIDADNDFILTGAYDNTVALWNKNGDLSCSMVEEHKMAVKDVKFIKLENDKLTFLSASQDQTILVWQYDILSNTPVCVHTCRGHAQSIDALAVHASNAKFASGSWDKMIKIWDAKVDLNAKDDENDVKKMKSDQITKIPSIRTPLLTLSGHKEPVSSLLWNGDQLISTGWDHCIRLWDIETATNMLTLTGNKAHLSLSFSLMCNLLATGSTDKHIRLWDPRTSDGTVVKSILSSHDGWIPSVQWSLGNEHQLVSGSYDNLVKLWDIRSPKKCLFDLESHTDKVMCVCWGKNHKILSGGADCQVHVSNLKSVVTNGDFETEE